MKVMISQPMNGVPDSEVRKIQDDLKEKFAKYNIDVIDSFLTEVPSTEIRNPRLFYLGRTIQNFLSDVDAVYFCTGWERAKGCRIERHICEEYGIPILDEEVINDGITDFIEVINRVPNVRVHDIIQLFLLGQGNKICLNLKRIGSKYSEIYLLMNERIISDKWQPYYENKVIWIEETDPDDLGYLTLVI